MRDPDRSKEVISLDHHGMSDALRSDDMAIVPLNPASADQHCAIVTLNARSVCLGSVKSGWQGSSAVEKPPFLIQPTGQRVLGAQSARIAQIAQAIVVGSESRPNGLTSLPCGAAFLSREVT
jgi:hypothetical protein